MYAHPDSGVNPLCVISALLLHHVKVLSSILQDRFWRHEWTLAHSTVISFWWTPAGGMRQVGVLAAPGMVALRETPALLHADHKNARLLAEGEGSW